MANLNYTLGIAAGRLTSDIELKQTQGGTSVCSFCVASNKKQKAGEEQKDANYIDVVAWGKTAEFVSRYFRKGSSILVSGDLDTDTYTDKDGKKIKRTRINATKIEFVDSKSEADSQAADNAYAPSYGGGQQPDFEPINTEDDDVALPF